MTSFAPPERVFVRPVSRRYADCVRTRADRGIDVAVARDQHAVYITALRAAGVLVEEIAADDEAPDACFVEDTAVVLGPSALATCPGASSRRREVAPVAESLGRAGLRIEHMALPATLDGGDVLRIGRRLFVGLSTRTNPAGVDVLARAAAEQGLQVVPMAVRGGLHLKSACSLGAPSLLLYDPLLLREDDLAVLRGAGVECLASLEPEGANVLALGDVVLVSAAAPGTAAALRQRADGPDVRVVDVSEIHEGDGALTCLSLRIPRTGTWCT
jgi:dimethylargininase